MYRLYWVGSDGLESFGIYATEAEAKAARGAVAFVLGVTVTIVKTTKNPTDAQIAAECTIAQIALAA